jgi:2-polyprenyl-6-methoxyphenol hydroxylase-like FAD-dependent oxidoreductase
MESLNADRKVLRSVLMSGLEPFVKFARGFNECEQSPTGVKVRFMDGKEVEGSVLVGADGTKSGVKKQLLPDHVLSILKHDAREVRQLCGTGVDPHSG